MSAASKDMTKAELLEQNEDLRRRLEEAEQTLEAIRTGEVDALVVSNAHGERIYTLTGAEHVYRVIVETMNEAALTVDPDGTILFCNQRFCDLMKTPMHEGLGRKVIDFVAWPQRYPLERLMAAARTGPAQQHITLLASDGTAVPVQLSASALHTDGSASICLVASDLTELEESANSVRVLREQRQALEESESRFRTIFEASQDAIVLVDDDQAYVQANPAVKGVFGWPPEDLIGRRIDEFMDIATDFAAVWRRFLREGTFRGEMRIIDANGQARIVDCYAVARILPGRHLAVIRDITERKLAEETLQDANERLQIQTEELRVQAEEMHAQAEELRATNEELRQTEQDLRESRRRLEVIVDSIADGFYALDRQWRFTHINDAALAFFHKTRDEVLGRTLFEVFPDVRGSVFETEYRRAMEAGAPAHIEAPSVITDRIVEIHAYPGPENMTILFRDITERQRMEQALRESEQRFHRLFEDDLTGNFVSTPEGRILLCNPAFAQIFGFASAQEAVGTSMLDLYLDAADREPLVERLKRQGKIDRQEAWRKRRDGAPIYIVENLVGHFNDRGELYEVKGYVFDSTERKRAEEALRESEQRLKLAQRAARIGVFDWDMIRDTSVWTEEFCTIFDLRPEDSNHPSEAWQRIVTPQERARVEEEFWAAAAERRPEFATEYRILRPDGSTRWVANMVAITYDEAGAPVRMIGVALDITERKEAEIGLRIKDTAMASSLNAIAMADLEGRLTYINPAFLALWGYEDEREVLGRSVLEFWEEPQRAAEVVQAIRNRAGWVGEMTAIRKDGTSLVLYLSANTVYDDAGAPLCLIGMFVDITRRKQAEESLRELTRTLEVRVSQRTAELQHRARQLQKLALELSQAEDRERKRLAEILHDDLQQQLAAAKFHVGILAGRVRDNPGVQKYAGQIDNMLRDAVETSRNLSHELSPAVMYHGDLGEILEWLASQVRAKHGLIVHVEAYGEINTHSDALKAFLFKAVQEMLFNAVKHARVGEARVRVRRMGRYITLSVSDRGRGFDPRELKQTAGFGLLSIRERIGLLGGRMRIHSIRGWGSRFILTVSDGEMTADSELRIAARPVQAAGIPGGAEDGALPQRTFRVLIADDHEIVRQGLASLLNEARDVEVIGAAANGREAVDMTYQLRPDVVIMDVAMPLMSGEEAARQIRKHLPQTRIVALSMYDEVGMMDRMHRAGAEGYILKTAPAEELLAAVRGTP